jgi:hypothetical protein
VARSSIGARFLLSRPLSLSLSLSLSRLDFFVRVGKFRPLLCPMILSSTLEGMVYWLSALD